MSGEKYIGLDVHQATISVAVVDSQGKLIMESILETKASTILDLLGGLRGTLSVTFEEGTWAAWFLVAVSGVSPAEGDVALLEAVYYVLEAKFFGERAGGVGKRTFLSIHERDKKPFHLPQPVIEEIRTLWETKGAPRMPPESDVVILKAIREWEMNNK